MTDAFNSLLPDDSVTTVAVAPPETPLVQAVNPMPVGTPLFSKPNVVESGRMTNTQAVVPAETTTDHSIFMGVTFRGNAAGTDGEAVPATGAEVRAAKPGGDILVRVNGAAAAGSSVGASPGHDYLVPSGTPTVGTLLQDVPDNAAVYLVRVRTAGAARSGGLNLRGEYVPEYTYEVNDVVAIYSGAATGTYCCVQNRPGTDPATNEPVPHSDPAHGTYWMSLPMGSTVGAWT
jgi:hypothetical protein